MVRKSNYIYGLTDDGITVYYVGYTTWPPGYRLSNHRQDARKGGTQPIHFWMREVGLENVSVMLLADEPDHPAPLDLETEWILKLRNQGHPLRNVSNGGPGNKRGYRFSDESRKRMSESAKKKTFTAEHRANMSKAQRRRFQDPEQVVNSVLKGAHNTHARKGQYKPDCPHCSERDHGAPPGSAGG